MRKSTIVSTLVLASALALPVMAYAQADTSAEADQSIVTDSNRDNDRDNWGWLGLLGLVGLMGLKRHDREKDRDNVRTRQAV